MVDRRFGTFWQRFAQGVRRVWQRSDWERFAGPNWQDSIMATAVTDRFHAKQGRSTGRWILEADGRRLGVYLKRHYRLPRWRGLFAALWPGSGWSPALQEWGHLEWARAMGLPVPAAVAAGEYIGPWGRLQSFLAVEELAGMLPLHEAIPAAAALLDAETFSSWKRGLVAELARLTRALHQRRWFHKDLYLCHFYIPEALARAEYRVLSTEHTGRGPALDTGISRPETWYGRVHLIDLHRLGHHPWTWRFWQVKDLAQMLYSSEIVGISARDRLRFWRHYAGGERRGRLLRWVRYGVLIKWQRYRRHNLKRKQRKMGEHTLNG
jgi:heptose I phosphotransferase